MDAGNMYLESKLPEPQYVRFKLDEIPKAIQTQYNVHDLVHNNYVYARINMAWYGLKESGKIANDDIVAPPAGSIQAMLPPPALTSAKSMTGTRIGWPVPCSQRF